MRVLVTGGAGFIGSHIVDRYVAEGYDVAIIDDLSTGVKENINPNVRFYQGTITDKEFVAAVIEKEKPEALNHHAAHIHVGRSVADPLFDATVNIDGTINLMQSLVKVGSCKKVIFASTGGAMYGNKQTPFTEDMAEAPLSPYGVSKRAVELYLGFYREQYGIKFTVLRYANVYGPRQNPHGEAGVVSIFAKNILGNKQPVVNGDGRQTRDYVYVEDVAAANELVLAREAGGIFNIGTGVETDVNEIFRLVNHEFGSDFREVHGPPRPGEQETSCLSFDSAKRELGWDPKVELAEGIKMTVEWFKKNPKRV
ncbi:UDP-glucose 4-epimerase [Candidatus Kuenenbacteria bacterium RIFCSPLOWO2_12_FULL_42_13]|uniref:UDP-glucose 4-epimerase n=1 Tax=Candidatus Kuenenbacteria bacterium RIFCSPLOWO2_12_FULL_42_13 TaxID=1798565 RepID=A0A1F6G1E1_9BACT|nr:MAG: UDP-glucose 4-epimerase [Candidatus Kuenenbacteria bacterium RIFCSPLOWO2_12_FULL_42_13]